MQRFPYSHPADAATRSTIADTLRQLEAQHNIRILYACESGSRAWGFASPDSDYDVRFLYVHAPQWYLSVQKKRDVLELPVSDDLDICGWELRKTLRLLGASNPTLLEWLQSPIVYHADEKQHQKLHALAHDFFNPTKAWHHYQSMAYRTCRAYLQQDIIRHKKYFYALRPLLAAQWIRAYRSVPPMRFADLAEAMLSPQTDAKLTAAIKELLILKMQASEAAGGAPWTVLQHWIETQLEHNKNQPLQTNKPEQDCGLLDAFLFETVMH